MDRIEQVCYNRDMTQNTDNKPKYELLGYDEVTGNEIRLYQDGSKRNQNGRLIELPSDVYDNPVITSENARDYHRMRKQKILDAIEQSVMDVTRTKLPSQAIGAIVGRRAEIAMKDDSRVGNEAAKIVLQAIDAYQNRVIEDKTVTRNEITLDDNTRELLERLAQMKRDADDDVIDV